MAAKAKPGCGAEWVKATGETSNGEKQSHFIWWEGHLRSHQVQVTENQVNFYC